jgi:hypothetical protein
MAAQKGPLTDEADEVIDAIAKMVAKLTSQQDGVIRQQLVEQLMRAIIKYDAEFRREDGPSFGAKTAQLQSSPHARH